MSKKLQEHLGSFHDNGIYLATRSIDVTGEFNIELYEKCLKNLHALDSSTGNINIFINSEGGEVETLMAIFDLVRGCRNHVRALVYGSVHSSASLLLQACDERLMSPNSYMMIHKGTDGSAELHPTAKARWDKHSKKVGKWMYDTYLEKIREKQPKYTKSQLTKILEHDTILYPQDCIDLGLADKIEERFFYDTK